MTEYKIKSIDIILNGEGWSFRTSITDENFMLHGSTNLDGLEGKLKNAIKNLLKGEEK